MIKKYLFISLIVVFAVTSVFYTIEAVTSGAEVASLEKTSENLSKENVGLEDAFVKTLSLTSLQEKSAELGFIKPVDIVYVSETGPVTALR